ncbi:right-handed parallel beta-helix repeat-containing protein [Ferruginibacter sp. HRS2-29]|uniref:right-handed parallel beta-helix repeat-containing protein n=1 Tax=Ferruginibacter sp. HRS2-29 TaxID=2487334 RepID=UPI0020CDC43D|nr:right-handed parallel beta-helix repeat-containing protein [Ferruginibacter sp. HRS2-29]MCP9749458.1 coagulation factor 5/8 type domain-containing protein [Ferruginibacter sp. HRS2-29]
MLHIAFLLLSLTCGDKIMAGTAMHLQVRRVDVSTSAELKTALETARPGDEIVLADGVYKGKFVVPVGINGTASKVITLTGSRHAILDAGSINTGYVFHLQGSWWLLKGFSVTNGLKGIIVDGANHNVLEDLKVSETGEEGIHLRKFSSHNIISKCIISNTGLKTADYGEGIYIGSAKNNWAKYSNGKPDLCDSNTVTECRIGPGISAECIDIKEGTTGTAIRNNFFDAAGITGANSADSWIDVKGNNSIIENNTGTNPGNNVFKDGYQVHCAVNGWGNNNEFKGNISTVNGAGYGFSIQLSGSNGTTVGNKVYSNNTVKGAASGIADIPLSN